MSDAYLLLDEGLLEPADAAAPPRTERLLKRIAFCLGIALAIELVWFIGILPAMPFARVVCAGTANLSRDAILAAAGVDAEASFYAFDAARARARLERLPLVASVRVVRAFPDRLTIEVAERTAVAVSLAVVDGRSVPLAFAADGVVIDVGGRVARAGAAGPIVSGLAFEAPAAGARLPAYLEPFLADLSRLRREAPALLDALSEIRVQPVGFDGYELYLYPIHRAVRVRIGPELNEEGLRYMMLVLDVLASRGIEADEIDFRTGTATYRVKEALSG